MATVTTCTHHLSRGSRWRRLIIIILQLFTVRKWQTQTELQQEEGRLSRTRWTWSRCQNNRGKTAKTGREQSEKETQFHSLEMRAQATARERIGNIIKGNLSPSHQKNCHDNCEAHWELSQMSARLSEHPGFGKHTAFECIKCFCNATDRMFLSEMPPYAIGDQSSVTLWLSLDVGVFLAQTVVCVLIYFCQIDKQTDGQTAR